MRLVWFTDMHLDHITADPLGRYDGFYNQDNDDIIIGFCKNVVKNLKPDAVMIGGDISNAYCIDAHLRLLSKSFGKKVYFVLGNHDAYGSSLAAVDMIVQDVVKSNKNLTWLDRANPIKLTDNTCLIGSSLWTDGKSGNWRTSNVWLNDYNVIAELKSSPYDTEALEITLKSLAKEFTRTLIKKLKKSLTKYKNVIMLTHVPPFWEGSFYNGKVQDANWAPHFVCTIAGEKIKEVMMRHPNNYLTVYSGHTHSCGEKQIADNIYVKNGEAQYKHMRVQEVIEVE